MKKVGIVLCAFMMAVSLILVTQGTTVAAEEVVTLKVAHQWPQNPEDPLIATTLKFTDEITKRTNGAVQFKFYPAQSLVKAKSAFQAMQKGVVDVSILPYIYAAGIVPQLNFSQWVCAFESHDAYFAWRKSKGYELLESKVNDAGVKTLVWLHYSVGLASNGKYIATPADAKGVKVRANGRYPEMLFASADAGITPMVSAEIYTAAQRGMLEAVVTSSPSMAGYKLYEVFDHYLSPLGPCIDYGMEPICISMKTWNEKLNDAQRKIFLEVAAECEVSGLELLKAYDEKVTKMFKDAGCNVREMTQEEFGQWRKLAEKAVWPVKRDEVPDGNFFYKDAFPELTF
ncbi:MAG: TRAP transporter substrate-binding protein DctP [Deltaproteobacteria bacterium]|nr:TRAP transporter substrate-binding protein DctP [Deltaproteobacteria bacterium]